MLKSLRIILFASLTVMVATGTTGSRPLSRARFQDMGVVAPSADDPLSVMTYNVRGLPWPIAWGRADALAQIGDRLAALRRALDETRRLSQFNVASDYDLLYFLCLGFVPLFTSAV